MRRFGGFVAATVVLASMLFAAPSAGASSKAELRSKLLTRSEFPAGWTTNTNSSTTGAVASGCLADVEKAPPGETKVTAHFQKSQLPALDEELVEGPDASAAYNRLKGILSNCKQFTVTQGGQKIAFTVGAISLPTAGNESSAYQVTFGVQGLSLGADIVLFRVGTIDGLILYGDIGQPDQSNVLTLVTSAVDKVDGKTPPSLKRITGNSISSAEPPGGAPST